MASRNCVNMIIWCRELSMCQYVVSTHNISVAVGGLEILIPLFAMLIPDSLTLLSMFMDAD